MSATDSKGTLAIRLPKSLRQRLDEIAAVNYSTPSREARIAISRYLDEQEKRSWIEGGAK